MIIYKLPVDTQINCECGCMFEFNTDDVMSFTYYENNKEHYHMAVECPFCKDRHIIHKISKEIQRPCQPAK